ncbi:hypothetical protein IscW_ISCW016463, partial [Ixodes scapularis]
MCGFDPRVFVEHTDAKERLKSKSATQEQFLEKKLLQESFGMEQQVYPSPAECCARDRASKRGTLMPRQWLSPLGASDTYLVPKTDPHDSVPTEFIECESPAGDEPSVSSGESSMEHGNGRAKRK